MLLRSEERSSDTRGMASKGEAEEEDGGVLDDEVAEGEDDEGPEGGPGGGDTMDWAALTAAAHAD